jgi:flagellin
MTGLSINTNGPSMIAVRNYSQISKVVASSMEKLATGSRINRGADDPAGLISSEDLRAALASLDAESRGMERTDAVANVADGALAEVSELLSDANAAEVAMANKGGMSRAERDAHQMEIDSARQSAERIVATTRFNGERVLGGNTTLSAGGESIKIERIDTGDLGAAMSQVATLRGKIGAFQKNVIGSQQRSNAAAIENTAAAYSAIRDTDYAAETAALSRGQLLQRSTLGVLVMANSLPRNGLSLLA